MEEISIDALGGSATKTITAQARNADGGAIALRGKFTWKTSDDDIVSKPEAVKATDDAPNTDAAIVEITGLSDGIADITVSAESINASLEVEVFAPVQNRRHQVLPHLTMA